MRSLLVTGADGQLGYFVRQRLGASRDVVYPSRQELDLSSSPSIEEYFAVHGPVRTILNLAAYTAVDKAETEKTAAWQVNAIAPAELGVYADRIIHISTDYVFDGEKRTPYTENDATHPLSYYGESKQAGEVKLMLTHENAVVIRTSWLYSERPGNFLTKILEMARTKPELRIVADQRGTPTYAADLADVLVRILDRGIRPGIYHYSGGGETTWHEFAEFFVREAGLQTPIVPISTSEYPTPAQRPAYSVLDKSKIKRELNLNIIPWQESVKKCLLRMS